MNFVPSRRVKGSQGSLEGKKTFLLYVLQLHAAADELLPAFLVYLCRLHVIQLVYLFPQEPSGFFVPLLGQKGKGFRSGFFLCCSRHSITPARYRVYKLRAQEIPAP